MYFCSNTCEKNSGSKLYYVESGKLPIACALLFREDLSSATGCTWGGRKAALHICAHSGNSAQTDAKKCSFSSEVVVWMVISYVAGTPAGAVLILQSTQLMPASPRDAVEGAVGAHKTLLAGRGLSGVEGKRYSTSWLSSFCFQRGTLLLLQSTNCSGD